MGGTGDSQRVAGRAALDGPSRHQFQTSIYGDTRRWVGWVARGCVRIGSHSGGQRDGQAAPATPAAAHRSLRPTSATPVAIPSLQQPPITPTPHTIPVHPHKRVAFAELAIIG